MTDAYKIPNSCNTCRMDKTTLWTTDAMRQWKNVRQVMRSILLAAAATVVLTWPASAQEQPTCRFVCDLEWKVEPTFTVENLLQRHRVQGPGGEIQPAMRDNVFETVLALDMKTKLPRLAFVVEASAMPFEEDNTVQLEFESDFYVLTDVMTEGWVESHLDLVDQFSPSARPDPRRAYGHKLDFEWDTAFRVFNWLPEGRWLHNVELETSLDYLATGHPKRGDVFPGGFEYLDDASPWSLSFVIVLPVAPF